jgi:ABC-type nitrate/sulfonate/bicarbonate transport system substrate-binding protein
MTSQVKLSIVVTLFLVALSSIFTPVGRSAVLTISDKLSELKTNKKAIIPKQTTLQDLKVRLNWFADGEHAYLYYGQELGYFKKIGVRLIIEGGKGSELSAKLLSIGDADLGLVSADALLAARAQGSNIQSLGIVYNETPVTIYSIDGRPLNRLEDLYGRKLGVLLGSNTYIQYEALTRKLGIDRSKIIEMPVDGAAAPGMLLAGQIDALMYYTHHYPIKSRQLGYEVHEIRFNDLGISMYGMAIAYNSDLTHKVNMNKLINAIQESLQAARKNPKAAVDSMAKVVTVRDPKYELEKLKRVLEMAFSDVPDKRPLFGQTSLRWAETGKTLVEMGVIKNMKPVEGVFSVRAR